MPRKFLVSIDLNQNELQNGVIQNLATAPSSPAPIEGQIYYNTTSHVLYYYNGSAWVTPSSAQISVGLLSARPTASTAGAGQFYYATDNQLMYESDGTNWNQVSSFGSVTAQTSYGASSGNGTATSYARSDHTHGTPSLGTSTPNAISGAAGAAGSASVPSKEDHQHAFTPSGNLAMGGYIFTGLGSPSASTDSATKGYVDGVAQGLDVKASVIAATLVTGTLATAYANGSVIDGITLATGNRILIKNQSTGSENGIYTVNATGAPTRATDMDNASEFAGAFTFVESGTQAGTGWVCTNTTVVVGTTPITFVQFSGAGTYTASNGVALTGSNFTFAPRSGYGLQTGASGAEVKLATTSGLNLTTDLAVGAGNGISVLTNTVAIDSTVVVSKYAVSVGNGSLTSITVNHALNTRDVVVTVYDNSSPYAEVMCDVQHTDANNVTLLFTIAPTTNQYRVVVHA